MAAAAGWVGVLVDADCKQPGKPEACPVTVNSRHFGLVRDGVTKKYFVVGPEGDEKILAVLADYQKEKGQMPSGSAVKVWFTGRPDGNKLALKDFALK
jgi:hypothetical protein